MTISSLESSLLAVFLLLLTRERFVAVLRAPAPLGIGLASQFGWMPLAALAIAVALELPPEVAVGLVIMGCSSGGTSSNFFSYISRADLALSVSMTVTSTVVGVVAVPLVLWAYTAPFTSAELQIPYARVATTLVAVVVPVAAGVFLRSRSPRWARRAETWGSFSGWAVLGVVIAGSVQREGAALLAIPARTILAATLLGPLGFALGYLGSRALGLGPAQRRAVSLETGIQNAPLAIAIVLLSFPADVVAEVLVAPLLYGVIVVPISAALALGFRRMSTPPGR